MAFSAATLDLSRFPPPIAVRGFSYEAILAARKARLPAIFAEFGYEFDAYALEVDPAMIYQKNDAYREMLVYAELNDRVRSVMVAFAQKQDLDQLALFYNLERRVIGNETTGNLAPIYESDEEFRRMVLLAPEAFSSAGPPGAYLFHALKSDPRVLNADVWTVGGGQVIVAIQSREGDGTAPVDLIAAVRAYFHQQHIKPLTDVVNVRSVNNIPYEINYTGYCLPGPDPAALDDLIKERLSEMAAYRRTPSRDMPRSAIIAAGSVDPLDKFVLHSPANDIAMDLGEVAVLSGITGKVLTYAG